MSFKLLFASTFGLIKSTKKIEAVHEALLADFRMYSDFEKSADHKEYLDLEMLINSAAFKQKKSELQKLTFKGSKEAALLIDLKKLENNRRIKKFFAIEISPELARYGKIKASGLIEKQETLKKYVSGSEFGKEKAAAKAKGKMEFENSEAFAKFQEFKQLQQNDDLRFYLRFEKSSAYKNFISVKDSSELKRLKELQETKASEAFKNRVSYLEDPKKWEKTEDAQNEKRFDELKKLPETLNYLKYKNSSAFDFFKKWDLIFEDRFESGKLNAENWITKSHWANETLGQNFSQIGDLQGFTDGKNVLVDGKSLKIEVRKEKTSGIQWQMPFGFIDREFDYSSGIISTAGAHWWNHGILEAKVKYAPNKNLVDAIYLLGKETSPQINLLEMGAKNQLGTLSKNENGLTADCASISGLKTGEFYIFRLEWTSDSLAWKVNEKEILSMNLHVPSQKMHLNAASILVSEPNGELPHRFEIDWIRFYQHRVN